MTDAFTDHAVKFIDDYGRKPDPFFLYLAFTSPHWPLHAWPEDIAKYRGKYRQGWDALRAERHERQIELGIVDRKWPLTPRDPRSPPGTPSPTRTSSTCAWPSTPPRSTAWTRTSAACSPR